ncbi:hypothetical protein A0256_12660 [Mucilaginibacter sp. PAMC 26640]|nr:hypothetical protein A0256_12660 [Mucilaginibacter sp. PAMC 26640]
MTPHIATGTFEDLDHAEDARQYLLAYEFEEEDFEIKPFAATDDDKRIILNIYTDTSQIAQEAVDVLRNYGAVDINMIEAPDERVK